jgi:copper resistance protein B
MTAASRKAIQAARVTVQLAAAVLGAVSITANSAWAQAGATADPHAGHAMPMPAAPSNQSSESATAQPDNALSGAARQPMDMSAMQGGSPPPDARDPHAYAGGQDFGPYRLELMDMHNHGAFRAENFETTRTNGRTETAFDLEAWFGQTYDRAVLKSEGGFSGGEIAQARTELLWGHAFAPFWDAQLGTRYDSGPGPNRTWLAVGVQGLAPYWFEVEATAYVGEASRSALRFDASYELLLTQKLILQPRLEMNFYGKRDAERALGSGLADAVASLRLRYEIRRELAPYVGVEWLRKYGETEDLARAAGEDPCDARFVLGLRFWF